MKKITNLHRRQLCLVLSFLFSISINAQVSGTVWQDLPVDGTTLNTYGIKDANELGVQGVTVTAYPGGMSTTTASDGTYTIAGAPAGAVRVEFSWPTLTWAQSSPDAAAQNTSVQFVTAPATGIDFGLHYPSDYSQADPVLGTPRYVSGDPLLGGASGTFQGFIGFNYSFTGEGQIGGPGDDFIPFATTADIGSTWGTAYERSTGTLFLAASYRRHVGLGPLNTSGIYAIDFSTGTPGAVTSWLDINTLVGVDAGADPRALGTDLDSEGNVRNYDWRAYPAVGKIAMGDMDISEDGKTLYVVNLNDKTVLPIDIATQTLSGAAIAIPDPGCSNAEYRPWALEVHHGELYVGVVCSAETSQQQSDLVAHVMRLSGGSFTSVFSFSLDYPRGTNFDALFTSTGLDARWDPWTDDFYGDVIPDGAYVFGNTQFFPARPQPILSDIEFDVDGSLILGFLDRLAYQTGYDTWPPDPTESLTNTREFAMSAGDILRASPDGVGGWNLESNGSSGGVGPTSGAGTGQGNGGGEFYHGDEYFSGGGARNDHQEVMLGGLAFLAGSGQVVSTAFDPINDTNDSGGLRWLNNTTGESDKGYLLYRDNYPPEQGKAAGLGDVEVLADAAPVEIGNLVWEDTDGDGVQDANEPGISGVIVELVKGGVSIATATTDANGNYIFSNDPNGTSTLSHRYNIDMLMSEMAYTVRVPNISGGTKQLALGTNILTSMDTGEGSNTNINDSDGTEVGLTAEISVLSTDIPLLGANNHTFDIGFSACTTVRCGTTTAVKN